MSPGRDRGESARRGAVRAPGAAGRTRRAFTKLGLVGALVAVCCTLIMPGAATGSAASWNDTAKVTAAPVQLGGLPAAPAKAGGGGLGCAVNNSLIGTRTMTYSWVAGSWYGTPLVYSATAVVANNGKSVSHTFTVGSGQTSIVVTSALLSDLLTSLADLLGGLSLAQTSTVTVTVQSRYVAGGSWASQTIGNGEYYTVVLGLLGSFTCK